MKRLNAADETSYALLYLSIREIPCECLPIDSLRNSYNILMI